MSDMVVLVPLAVQLTDEDLQIAEETAQRLAARCRRKDAIEEAAQWQRVGEIIARARTPRCASKT